MCIRGYTFIKAITVAIIFLCSSVQISAQEYDVQAPISPELIAHAQTGDAYANYVIAYKYFLLDDAKSLKQALQHLTVAKEGYLAAGEDGISGLMGIQKMIGDVHTELFEFAMAIKMLSLIHI